MLVSCVLALFLGYFIYRLITRTTDLPPGPFNLPIVGYLPFIKQPVYQHFANLSKKYGDIFLLNLGTQRVVVLSSLHYIREAFKLDAFSGRPNFPTFAFSSENNKGIIFGEGESWIEMRRFTLRTLRDFGFGKSSLENIIDDEIKELVENLKSSAGEPIELSNRFNLAVVNALWTILTGERIQHDDKKMAGIVKALTEVFQKSGASTVGFFLPFVNRFPPFKTLFDKQVKNIAEIKAVILEIVNKHRQNQNTAGESDFIHSFFEKVKNCTDENSPFNEKVAERQLVVTLFDLFVAGTETTSTSLLWLICMLATYPKIQERIQKEIDQFLPEENLPSSEYRTKLVYTEAVLMETLRYSSLVPFGISHVCVQDTRLGPYLIPKGTVIMPNLYQVMHDPQWWERPNEFFPEHFINEDGSLKNSAALIPFSIGKRVCLGETLAKTEFFLFATNLLKNFTFSFPTTDPNPSLKPIEGVTLSPQDYKVIATVR